jgi:hypothetical protein
VGQGDGIRLAFPQVKRVEFFGDLGSGLEEPDVGVFDYHGGVLRGPTAWLWLRRAQVEWNAGRIPTASAAMAEAQRMTVRWKERVRGRWREEGLQGVRQQVQTMLAEEQAAPRAPGDPRAAVRPGYLRSLADIGRLTL